MADHVRDDHAEPTDPPAGRARYGVDSPGIVAAFAALAIGALSLAIAAFARSDDAATIGPLIATVMFGVTAVAMVRGSLVGKPRLWAEIVEGLHLRGDEQVLDVGCGRGQLTNLLASRLPAGRVVGVDVWNPRHEWGSSRASAEENARAEGVGDRVELVECDLAEPLPFDAGTFDLVVSSMALHNVTAASARRRACQEMARVVAPGGRVVIVDNARTQEYVTQLEAAGLIGVERSGLRWSTYPPCRVVTALKPRGGTRRRR